MKRKFDRFANIFLSKNIFVFGFFTVLIFVCYRALFNSYFEADEWPAFTNTFPLTGDPLGFLKVMVGGDTGANLFQVQHIAPISKEAFFLSTLFFGTNFAPYAFVSLFLHSLNTFLVFVFIKQLLPRKIFFAFLGALFFSLLPVQMHAITWAAIYPSTLLPVTFALLSIIFLRLAFAKENKKFIYFSVIFLFLSIFTKETTAFLFLLLPFMMLIEKRVFSLKFLSKIFMVSLVIYSVIRFLIPGIYNFENKVQNHPKDTGTIVSRDLSIYKNLQGEVMLRTVTFPLRMMGTLFLPRPTVFSIVQFITPIMIPMAALGDSSSQLAFLYGPGNFMIIYLASLAIIIFCLSSVVSFIKKRKFHEARALVTGLAIVVFSALPLVAIIFSFPRWGYDFYFDSRYYYGPSIGAAIIFPFLIFGFAKFLSKNLHIKKFSTVVLIVFIIWFVNNMYVFGRGITQFTQNFANDRKEVVSQLKTLLPILPTKTVFYFETDGKSAFGPNLPFFTSVPQAITVVYYDRSPLPDSFFDKTLFDGKPQGYYYSEGRGLGYYTSKKELSKDLVSGKFEPSDIYAFYYYAQEIKLKNISPQIREEMRDFLNTTDVHEWKSFQDSLSKIKFLYPSSAIVNEIKSNNQNIIESFIIFEPEFDTNISIMNVSPSFDVHDTLKFLSQKNNAIEKNVFFDKYHFNNAIMVDEGNSAYFMRLGDLFLYINVENSSKEKLDLVERILGSLEIVNEKK